MADGHKGYKKVTFLSVNLCCVFLLIQFAIYAANDIECGSKTVTRPLVIAGARTNRGEWPFAAALYLVYQFTYLCGGTIISNKHVLTAAHCIQGKYSSKRVLPDEILVRIGVYNLTTQNEAGAVQRNISEIYVHPTWEVYEDEYDADIAILVLSDNFTFTNYIRPVCLPSDDDRIIDGANGYIVGWGITENQTYEEIPRQAVVKVLNDSYCYRRDYLIVPFSSSRTFCAGDGDGGPNFGDSGGGLFILSGEAWVQFGIISAIRTNASGHVTADSLAVYTNVKILKNWIVDTVTQTGSAVRMARGSVVKIGLHCNYAYASFNSTYDTCACLINDLDIRKENVEVISFTGSHSDGCTEQNVEMIEFNNGTMFYVPGGIGKILKNLIKIEISSRLSTKFIKRSKFKGLEKLVHFWTDSNDIETIEEDSLWDLANLEEFLLQGNKLNYIKEKTFERNEKLREVYLHYNELEFIPANLFQNNLFLEKISFRNNLLKTIDEETFSHNTKLREVYLDANLLESLPKMLLKNNLLLEFVELSDNLIKTIDDEFFNNKTHLREVYLNYNRLEFLPRNLFINTFFLETVSFENNRLNKILIDFNPFKNVIKIDFANNVCIDISFISAEDAELYPQRYRNKVNSVTQVQSLIDANCSSK